MKLYFFSTENVIESYKKFGFKVVKVGFGNAEKKEVHPLIAAAYYEMIENQPKEHHISLSELIYDFNEEITENLECYFGDASLIEYYDGFMFALAGEEIDGVEYIMENISPKPKSRFAAMLDPDYKDMYELYELGLKEGKLLKEELLSHQLLSIS